LRLTNPSEFNVGAVTNSARPDDLAREVYGLLGVPIDMIDMATVLRHINSAAADSAPFLISTINLNFLVTSRTDEEFRESLLLSDLCTADGMPIVWIAWVLGIPIKKRLAGSDIFEALKPARESARRLKVFLFGGPEGIAAAACQKLNADSAGMTCVGSFYPGFSTVDEMATDTIIDLINSSNADFLVAALGAKKGQAWLLRNHGRLKVPVRVHLGAAINFQAGALKRAPASVQKLGLEWLWRIKEEPRLWKRYWNDGLVMLQLLLNHVVPLIILARWHQLRGGSKSHDLLVDRIDDHKTVILRLNGPATIQNVGKAVSCFREAVAAAKNTVINFTDTCQIDARFLGLLLMLDKQLKRQRLHLAFTGVSPRIARIFRLNGFGFLLHTITE
jgi:N-acetylglucosaminyldiphosphoundecaprenol N-acetyl-beta-D-mannosaminyltransferase